MIKVKKNTFIFLFVFSGIIYSCDDNVEPDTTCLLERIQFDELNSLLFTTISGGVIYEVKQQLTVDDDVETLISFRFTYFEDSVAIINQTSTVTSLLPHLWVNTQDEFPVRVVRYFARQGVQLIHSFDYSDPGKLRISLDRVASDGSVLNTGFGDYFIDNSGNVQRLVIFGIDPEDSENFVSLFDRRYSYDEFTNPTKGFYLPYFNATSLPDPRFISNNNILSVNDGGSFTSIDYEYGAQSQVVKSQELDGSSLQFSYINCE